MDVSVVALAGGVGGAKLADGLASLLAPERFAVVVNTADDFVHLGLYISPDLDTVTYTLAGLADPGRGWGRADESWAFMQTLDELGGPTWFQLGDRDLALHHQRSLRLGEGTPLSAFTADVAGRLGVRHKILPMTDDRVETIVETADGELGFQEYFVARRCEPSVTGFRFDGIELASAGPGVLESLERADWVVICPSNPWVSIDPILAVEGVRACLESKQVVMVSPLIAGRAVKGPAAKMYAELGIEPSAVAVARHYQDLLDAMVIDELDADLAPAIEALGPRVHVEQTLMTERSHRIRMAKALLAFAVRREEPL